MLGARCTYFERPARFMNRQKNHAGPIVPVKGNFWGHEVDPLRVPLAPAVSCGLVFVCIRVN